MPRGERGTFISSVAFVASLLLIHGIYLTAIGLLAVVEARRDVSAVRAALRDSDLEAAEGPLDRLRATAQSADLTTMHVGHAVLAAVPPISRDERFLRVVSEASLRGIDLARESIRSLAVIAGGRSLGAALYPNARLDPGLIELFERSSGRAHELARSLQSELEQLEPPSSDFVARLHRRALRSITEVATETNRLNAIAGAIPELAGMDAPKRYLLAFQASSEARGTGGLIGVYAILNATDGRLKLEHVGPYGEINEGLTRPAEAPPWFERLYGDLLALKDFRHVNLGIHFPTVAEVILSMYEQASGEALDGVITVDPIVLEQFTRATGGLRASGWDVVVGPATARRLLTRDIYLEFGRFRSRAQNAYLRALIEQLIRRFRSGSFDALTFGAALSRSSRWQHLKIYSTHPTVGRALAVAGADADPTATESPTQVVWHNNFVGSKVDYYLHRHVTTRVSLTETGDARVHTSIELENRAPTKPSSLLIRPLLRRVANGHNRLTLHVLMPRDGEFIEFAVDGAKRSPLRGNEAGSPVVWDVVDIPAGETAVADVRYMVPNAATLTGEEEKFEMILWPQALVRPDSYTFELSIPAGWTMDVSPARRLQADGSYKLNGRLFAPKKVEASFDIP
jgi:hypothetical protein